MPIRQQAYEDGSRAGDAYAADRLKSQNPDALIDQ